MQTANEENISAVALTLMKSLVELLDDKWVTAARILEIADRLEVEPLDARIVLITGLKTLARGLPTGVFADLEARNRLLKVMQEALDLAISAEDEQA